MRGAAALALALAATFVPCAPPAGARALPRRVVDAFAPAGALFARGAADSGYAALEALAARALAERDDTLRTVAQFELGARLAWFGQLGRAIPILQEARSRAWTLRDSTRWVQSSQWLAYALNGAGRIDEGGPVARRALPAAVATGDARAESYLRLSSAYANLLTGRPADSRRGYRRALAMFEAHGDAFGACEALLGLGRTYTVTGPRDSALSLFARAARRAERARIPRVAASAYNNLASEEYVAGDPGAATEAWRSASRTLREAGDLPGELSATSNLCLALAQLGRADDARAIADTLLAHARAAGSPEIEAQARARLGLVELNAGRPARAARHYRAALATAPPTLELRADCTAGLMQALVPLDSAAAALALYDELQPAIEGRVTPSRRLELDRAAVRAAHACGRYERAEALARRLLARAREAGQVEQEVEAERQLARILTATGDRSGARAHLERADQAWRRQRGRATGLEWRSSLSNSTLLGTAWAEVELGDGTESRRDRIAPALAAIERVRSALLLELAAGPGGRSVPMPPVTLDHLQRRVLVPGELLLLAWTGNQASWLVAVTRDTAASVALPGDHVLQRDADLLRQSIDAAVPLAPDAMEAMLADAGGRLFGQVLPLLRRATRVVFVPSGSLHPMPVESLLLPFGPGGALAPLGTTHAFARMPSASLLALVRSRPRPAQRAAPELLVVAHPRAPDGRSLPQAIGEARALESRYRGVRLFESPRDAAAVLRAMGTARAVHLASHADFDEASPWRSALQLGDGAPVRARDLLGASLRPELVVLSACETAGGGARGGSGGLEGLSTALLCAGARGVVATLWPVADRAARRFVEAFYEEAEVAPDAATALARTRVKLRAAGAGVREWGAFTLVGDPAAGVRPVRKPLSLPGF